MTASLLGAVGPATAQDRIVANLTLDELASRRVSIASVAEKPLGDQPGIVTVITDREIAATGAVDLMDVLALVPGFGFAGDVMGVVGTGFRGVWAYEGKILLLDGDIDLLMTDVVMPEMNGPDLAQRLTAIRPGLKCLFVSGYVASSLVDNGSVLERGVHFLQKPFSVNELATKVQETLAS